MSKSNMINAFLEFSSNRPWVPVPNSTDVPNATDHTPDVHSSKVIVCSQIDSYLLLSLTIY